MSDLFFNKIAAALLAGALGFIGINKFADIVVHPDVPASTAFAYSLAPTETAHVEVAAPAPFPSAAWIASMDATKGAKVFKKCTSCHNAETGGKNGTGPALWNIVGRPVGATADFKYSTNMGAKGGNWGYEELDEFLTKPKAYIPKTKMAFIGLKKEGDRAALIEFLRLAADTPMGAPIEAPLPDAAPMEEMVPDMAEVPEGEQPTPEEAPKAGGH